MVSAGTRLPASYHILRTKVTQIRLSLLKTFRTFSNLAAMSPYGNRIWESPVTDIEQP